MRQIALSEGSPFGGHGHVGHVRVWAAVGFAPVRSARKGKGQVWSYICDWQGNPVAQLALGWSVHGRPATGSDALGSQAGTCSLHWRKPLST